MLCETIKRTAFKVTRVGQLVAQEASHRLGVPFGIIDLSPLSILSRGYAMATDKDGHVVKHADAGLVGSAIKVRISDGVLDCSVESVLIDSSCVQTPCSWSWRQGDCPTRI